MAALVVWGEDDHETRAKALATTYATVAQKIGVKPSKVANLETLVFWGHGDPSAFCGLDATTFITLVSAWKKLNSQLRTVEILTCNARHKQGGYPDSYTEQVVKKLTAKHADIRFRALPVAVTADGNECQFSILKWHPASGTWAYIGASGGDDKLMWGAAKQLEDFMPPRGSHVGYPRAHAAQCDFKGMALQNPYATKRNLDQKGVDKYNTEWAQVKNNSYVIAGTIGMLRWALTDIK